jgi:hypothetical protein
MYVTRDPFSRGLREEVPMALIRRRVAERMREANRANARRGTGPRTPAGKARSRLNALRHGDRSALAGQYLRLWWNVQMTCRREAGTRYDISIMPVPFLGSASPPRRRGRIMREFLLEVAPYLAPSRTEREAKRKRKEGTPLGKRDSLKIDDRNRQPAESKGRQ